MEPLRLGVPELADDRPVPVMDRRDDCANLQLLNVFARTGEVRIPESSCLGYSLCSPMNRTRLKCTNRDFRLSLQRPLMEQTKIVYERLPTASLILVSGRYRRLRFNRGFLGRTACGTAVKATHRSMPLALSTGSRTSGSCCTAHSSGNMRMRVRFANAWVCQPPRRRGEARPRDHRRSSCALTEREVAELLGPSDATRPPVRRQQLLLRDPGLRRPGGTSRRQPAARQHWDRRRRRQTCSGTTYGGR